MAALSLSMCSATTLLLCSLMNSINAFNGFLTWDMSIVLPLHPFLLLFCDCCCWREFLERLLPPLLLVWFWFMTFNLLLLWLTWCPFMALFFWSFIWEEVAGLFSVLDEEVEEVEEELEEEEWLLPFSIESTLWLKLDWTAGLVSEEGRTDDGEATIEGDDGKRDGWGGGVGCDDDNGEG